MIRKNKGHIVGLASMASFVAPPGIVDYAATKSAVMAFHEGERQLPGWDSVLTRRRLVPGAQTHLQGARGAQHGRPPVMGAHAAGQGVRGPSREDTGGPDEAGDDRAQDRGPDIQLQRRTADHPGVPEARSRHQRPAELASGGHQRPCGGQGWVEDPGRGWKLDGRWSEAGCTTKTCFFKSSKGFLQHTPQDVLRIEWCDV
jgi:hypothetical protein